MENNQRRGKVSISVIMGVHNQRNREELRQAVSSIWNQSFRDFEFLIYDDGSEEAEAEFLRQLSDEDGRVRLIRSGENRGLAHALNECIRYATGVYIARMDADDISAPERFKQQKDFLDCHPEYAFAGCSARLYDGQEIWGVRPMPEVPKAEDFLNYSPYIHPSVMFRKSALEAAGGYTESPDTLRCEDYELFMRMHGEGLRGYNLQQYLFDYRENRTSYNKRKFCYRIAETKIRYQGFKRLGLLTAKGMLYVVRPIISGLLPKGIVYRVKRRMNKM